MSRLKMWLHNKLEDRELTQGLCHSLKNVTRMDFKVSSQKTPSLMFWAGSDFRVPP